MASVVTPPPPPPTAPVNLVATASDYDEIDLTWTNTSTTQTGVYVQRSTDGSNWTTIAPLGPTAQSYSDTTLQPTTTYYYQVIAYNSGGQSSPSNVANATTFPGPPPGSAPYLRQIIIPTDFTFGPATLSGTVQLSMPATQNMTITLWCAARSTRKRSSFHSKAIRFPFESDQVST